MKQLILTCIALASTISSTAQNAQNPIKVNQVGYYPLEQKYATIEPTAKVKTFFIKNAKGQTVWSIIRKTKC